MNELLIRPRNSKYLSEVEKTSDQLIKQKGSGLLLKKMKYNGIFRLLRSIMFQDRYWWNE